jgi:hypothetical protein
MRATYSRPMQTFASWVIGLSAVAGLQAAPVELGGAFQPAPGTVVRWTVHNEMKEGKLTAVRLNVPSEGKVDRVEDRVTKVTYASPTSREVLIESGVINTVEEFFGKKKPIEQKNALTGVAVKGAKMGAEWKFEPAAGEATAEQKPELTKLARRASEEGDVFAGQTPEIGQSWDLDSTTFARVAGLGELVEPKGSVKATLKEVADGVAKVALLIDLTSQTKQADGVKGRLKLKCEGQWAREIATKLDRSIELTGNLTIAGRAETAPGVTNPFTHVTPFVFKSTREMVK